ncbi:MAG: ribulose-phosphate 3-epimerase [Candidatus Marinimicrobia bacterium]|jgi:ribulose-phosphate 3-epimerase|nr:ribulose-phosphate 3-epimerase [Candidatus Neomarinimicrobiota bacterium]MBT4736774.1 ribulose-phosphate 3-epimerase [Candidatus Neomarinimicrobiota bacterium]MBT5775839.1 ribulose-phosphate 3-epimerase [Candidatus Neomarinimicrobiota bacterium]MBT6942100.1 ribulose-phosphate 3-epimerase [Candidatus Neomarinimicrobiota bacterium]MCP4931004.1 ribulose-phosphate 3-epimerase [Candidatus Neomarinimicrobiota bacterium]|tara:strand:+ start:859 stop:1527 length:669 start_codon:yes stop_codon:yes gene_type:complete
MSSEFKLAPSILSADFANLQSALSQCEEGGAHWIHVDVMDNQFVPNLTIGPPVVKSLRPKTNKFIDVHMMVIEPEKLVEPFARAGADLITFHIEATDNPQSVIDLIKSTGTKVGISIKPSTPMSDIEPFYDQVDLILVMSVEPGFGGQGYIPESTKRIRDIKQKLNEQCLQDRVMIEVDGGIKLFNAKEVIDAGADVLVAGSAIFGTDDPVQTINEFYQLTE